jgi:hypothetical protein
MNERLVEGPGVPGAVATFTSRNFLVSSAVANLRRPARRLHPVIATGDAAGPNPQARGHPAADSRLYRFLSKCPPGHGP